MSRPRLFKRRRHARTNRRDARSDQRRYKKCSTILRKQYALGAVAVTDVLTQQTAVGQMMDPLLLLEKALAQQRDLLTALAGQYSTAEVPETFNLKAVSLPRDLPITLPATFVRQRPDVRAAESNVHAVSAQIGVAIAARLPNVTLSASAGYSAFSFAHTVHPDCLAAALVRALGVLAGNNNINAADFRRLHADQQAKGGGSRASLRPRRCIDRRSSPRSRTSPTRCAPCKRMTKAVKAANIRRAER